MAKPMTHLDVMGPITWEDVTAYGESKGLDPQEVMNAMHFWLKVGRLSSSVMNRGFKQVYRGYHDCPFCEHRITITWDVEEKSWVPEEHICPNRPAQVNTG